METRIDREKRVVSLMITKYCNDHHHSTELCKSCTKLKEYTFKRLLECPFAKDKPVCASCKIHCYSKKEKEKIKEVMRYAGPKMLFAHPADTFFHFFDKIKYKFHSVK